MTVARLRPWPGTRRRGPAEQRTDHIMQWSYRRGEVKHDRNERELSAYGFLTVQVFNIVAAFDGERLCLARAS